MWKAAAADLSELVSACVLVDEDERAGEDEARGEELGREKRLEQRRDWSRGGMHCTM